MTENRAKIASVGYTLAVIVLPSIQQESKYSTKLMMLDAMYS